MKQKPKNQMKKSNNIQDRKKDDEKSVAFSKISVSHDSKFQKDLHYKFFFEES